jgi:hypothetical protein
MEVLDKDIPQRNGSIVFKEIGDEFMLVSTGNNAATSDNILLLDEVGATIWNLIECINTQDRFMDAGSGHSLFHSCDVQ